MNIHQLIKKGQNYNVTPISNCSVNSLYLLRIVTSVTPAIKGFKEDGNSTISIGPVEISETGTDVKASFGGQFLIGIYLNISGKEVIDFWEKLNEAVYK